MHPLLRKSHSCTSKQSSCAYPHGKGKGILAPAKTAHGNGPLWQKDISLSCQADTSGDRKRGNIRLLKIARLGLHLQWQMHGERRVESHLSGRKFFMEPYVAHSHGTKPPSNEIGEFPPLRCGVLCFSQALKLRGNGMPP